MFTHLVEKLALLSGGAQVFIVADALGIGSIIRARRLLRVVAATDYTLGRLGDPAERASYRSTASKPRGRSGVARA